MLSGRNQCRWVANLSVVVGTFVAMFVAGRRRLGPRYAAARAVVERHCVGCHSEQPTVVAFPIAAGGILLDTAEEMQRHAERIKIRVVEQRSMPLLNKSEMTKDERSLLGAWVDCGAVGPEL